MLASVVLELEAARDGDLDRFTGPAVHGFWMNSWKDIDPAWGAWLHEKGWAADLRNVSDPAELGKQAPFTVSPLMGLPFPKDGRLRVQKGMKSWIRISSLNRELSRRVLDPDTGWLRRLPETFEIYRSAWRITRRCSQPAEHPWAGWLRYEDLRQAALDTPEVPRKWTLEFVSPTAIRGARVDGRNTAFLFPIPDRLLDSWRKSWNCFGPYEISSGLVDQARENLRVTAYRLYTLEDGRHKDQEAMLGWQGVIDVEAAGDERTLRNYQLLMGYAFFRGTGYHTPRGMGMTRLAPG